jgi:lipopolysaccharide/colanic/teichoic acid biosynthesis glycosyltransferase
MQIAPQFAALLGSPLLVGGHGRAEGVANGPGGGKAYRAAKRVLDVTLSLALLVCLLPVFLFCAVLVRLDSPGPILFRQQRVGERGRLFTFLKFRTMRHGADADLHRSYAASFIRGQAQRLGGVGEAGLFKLAGDPRVTRVGYWLRRFSLDELPQFLNVLWGDMSLVGPRPPIPYELDHYGPDHMRRLLVKPGLTGLWQVRGRSRTTFEEMVALDLEYIRARSLLLDLRILAQTVPEVLFAQDAR